MKKSVLILGCVPFPEFDQVVKKYRPQVWCINACTPPSVYHRWFQLHPFNHMVTALAVLEGFDRIIIGGVTFGKESENLWLARRKAADIIEFDRLGPLSTEEMVRLTNDLRGVRSGNESWAVPCLSYHLGIAQGRGIETQIFGEGNGIFFNKWGEGALYGIDPRAGGE